jgi:uncharacterized surface protein with fasciclin (FAS1) repeats
MKILLSAVMLSALAVPAVAQMANPMVGGAEMFADRTIVENAVNSADHTTLVAAVQAADLVDTLSGAGPFTVFAPTNAAFAALPAGTVDALVQPQNKDRLTQILTCHVVAGDVTSAQLVSLIQQGGGSAQLQTVGGCVLTATAANGGVMITDEQGRGAMVTVADVDQSNGVIHVVDEVLLPSAAAQQG